MASFREVKKPSAPAANLIDRVVGYFDPVRGAQRLKARTGLSMLSAFAGNGGYFGPGGRRNRPGLAGWDPGVADADSDIVPDLADLRGMSRDLARRNPIAGGTIGNVVTNVVGTGLAMQPAIDAEFLGLGEAQARKWKADTLREWRLFCESPDCDITGEQNFYELQALAFRSVLESGDLLVLTPVRAQPTAGNPYRLALQMIEADRICNENGARDSDTLVQGVETNAAGAAIRYHIANRHPGAMVKTGKTRVMTWTKVDKFGGGDINANADANASASAHRRNVLHLFDRRRPGQTRGVPYLAAVIEPLKQLGRYSDAEIGAAVISAIFPLFVEMDAEGFSQLFDDNATSRYIDSALGQKWDQSVPSASVDAPMKAINLLPGEKVSAPEVGRPNKQFDPFFMAVCKQIGVGLELPVEVVLKSFNSSYSAARAALLDAWRFYRTRRDWLATRLCQPVYELWLEEAVATRRIAAHGFFADPVYRKAWSAATWVGDGPGSIDPLKEVDAAVSRIAAGISTVAAESLLHDGGDWETKIAQRKREIAAFTDAGMPPLGGGAGGNGGAPKTYPSDPAVSPVPA